MSGTDMSSLLVGRSDQPDASSLAVPADASLNDSLGLDSLQSHVTADFGSAGRDVEGPRIPQVRMVPNAVPSPSERFIDGDDLPDYSGDEDDFENQSVLLDPRDSVQPLAEGVFDDRLHSRPESIASVRMATAIHALPVRRSHGTMEGSGTGIDGFDDGEDFDETDIHDVTFDGRRSTTPRSSEGEPTAVNLQPREGE